MASKFDDLRAGRAVDIRPGLSGRLNKDNKTLELSTGQVLHVGDDADFFPKDDSALQSSKQRELVEKEIKRSPTGEFGHQYSQQGVVGGGRDWVNYLTSTGDNYTKRKQAEAEVSERISEESPWKSAAATGASLATDIALTRRLPGVKAAPALVAASAGSRVLTEPGEVAKEAAVGAGLGYGLDKATGWLSRVAARRGANRALPQQQAQVEAQNVAGQQAHTLQKTQELQKYQAELNQRQNTMIQAQNAAKEANEARDASIIQLKNAKAADRARIKAEVAQHEQIVKKNAADYRTAVKDYEEAVKNVPKLQESAQKEHSENVINSAKKIERAFPENSKIYPQELGVNQFIDEFIDKAGYAGSREGTLTSKMLSSLFPDTETLSTRELAKRYQAIEEAIQRGSPGAQKLLNDFKDYIGNKIPKILENNLAYKRLIPAIQEGIIEDVKSITSKMRFPSSITKAQKDLDLQILEKLNENAKSVVKKINSDRFIEKIENGSIFEDLKEEIAPLSSFIPGLKPEDAERLIRPGANDTFKQAYKNVLEQAREPQQEFISALSEKMNSRLARYQLDALIASEDAAKKLGGSVKGTFGLSKPVEAPIRPEMDANPAAPNMQEAPLILPDKIAAPQAPPMPAKPDVQAPFIPQPMPTLEHSQSFAESTGDFLEKPLLGGKGMINNPITKLAGLKYLFGKAAIPAEAAYLGLKGLTSPTAGGEAARLSFKQFGVQAIERLAQSYPSYHNGILEDPRDRRSLAKEIEDDYEIPIEQKAIYQSKVNRGKPLNQPI